MPYIREDLVKSIRSFFYGQDFHEVLVPVLNKSVPHEENVVPLQTQGYYLSTSPERGLKRAIAKGWGNCFAIAPAFRALEGNGPLHMKEFHMLEWYRKDSGMYQVIEDTKRLLIHIVETVKPEGFTGFDEKGFQTVSLQDLFARYAGIQLKEALIRDGAVFDVALRKGYGTKGATWRQLWDQIFVNEIEPNLPEGAVFVTDYPASVSPLCKKKESQPYLAERFELYLNGIEIANGNTENTDFEEVRAYFQSQYSHENSGSQPIDTDFLEALNIMRLHSFGGCGLGVDRLAMLLAGAQDIREIDLLSQV